jgi:hypothetical protein
MCKDMHCVPNDCLNLTCQAGTHCVSGSCADNCAGAVCPVGQKCSMGQCVLDGSAPRDAGKESGPVVITTTTGTTTIGSTSTGTTGPGSGPGTGPGAGTGGSADNGPGKKDDGASCGCRVPGSRAPHPAALLVSLFALASFARRRTRPA